MWTLFVALLMALRVSGNGEVNVTGYLGESVLLPCTCLDRNENKEFKWQISNKALLYKHPSFNNSYKDRAAVFLSQNSSNCSIRLDNITKDDQEIYTCIFSQNELYQRFIVNLSVSAMYSVHQPPPVERTEGVMEFKCDVKGRYRETEIVWISGEQPLTNSSETNISATDIQEDPAGYHFRSKLMTKIDFRPEPKCHVQAKGITAAVISDPIPPSPSPPSPSISHHLWIVPVVLVLIFSLVLYLGIRKRMRTRRRFQSNTRDGETDNFMGN